MIIENVGFGDKCLRIYYFPFLCLRNKLLLKREKIKLLKNWNELDFSKGNQTLLFRDGTIIANVSADELAFQLLRKVDNNLTFYDDNSCEFTFRGKKIRMDNANLVTAEGLLISEIFFQNEYRHLKCKDKVVLDIGASIGDSAIYFALKEAKRVVAFEPFPYAYEIAKKNIIQNGITRVKLINAALGK